MCTNPIDLDPRAIVYSRINFKSPVQAAILVSQSTSLENSQSQCLSGFPGYLSICVNKLCLKPAPGPVACVPVGQRRTERSPRTRRCVCRHRSGRRTLAAHGPDPLARGGDAQEALAMALAVISVHVGCHMWIATRFLPRGDPLAWLMPRASSRSPQGATPI